MKWKTAVFGGCYTYVCVEGGNTYRETGALSRLPKEALYFPRQLQWFHLFFCIAVLLNDSLSYKFLLSDRCALYIRRSANTKKSDMRSCVLQTCIKTPERICRLTLFGFCFLAVSAHIKEALSSAGPWISHVQGEALSEFQAAALLPRAPAAFTCI